MRKKYLFICGCARSGTSITTDLLRNHSKIAIGRERYNSLFKTKKYNFTPNLFEKDRFCKELHHDDTHHNQLDKYYEDVFASWNQRVYFGDKIPSLFKEYDYLLNTFNQPKIIFLLRNIIDVSQSWENRKLHSIRTNGKWPHDRGAKEAIKEWNLSLKNTIRLLSIWPNNILIVPYEKLFTDQDLLTSIFNFIDLDISEEVLSFWEENTLRKESLEKKRIINLSSDVKNQICLQSDFESYRALNLFYESHFLKKL